MVADAPPGEGLLGWRQAHIILLPGKRPCAVRLRPRARYIPPSIPARSVHRTDAAQNNKG